VKRRSKKLKGQNRARLTKLQSDALSVAQIAHSVAGRVVAKARRTAAAALSQSSKKEKRTIAKNDCFAKHSTGLYE
jgi:hypothetical protein